jgi:hypothetical protein
VVQARNLLGIEGERANGHAWSSAAGHSRGQVRGRLDSAPRARTAVAGALLVLVLFSRRSRRPEFGKHHRARTE